MEVFEEIAGSMPDGFPSVMHEIKQTPPETRLLGGFGKWL
jgi:hypothetical protein